MKLNFNESALLITAGGKGLRMNSDTKKQYLNLNGKPVLYHTLKSFLDFGFKNKILVVPKTDINFVKNNILNKYHFDDYKVVGGGNTRHHSVYNGLKNIENCKYVYIHDGVRPFVNKSIMENLFNKICDSECKGVIPVIKLKDTIKSVNDNFIDKTLDRNILRAVQTPQLFYYDLLYKSYEKNMDNLSRFTDDASIMESENFKIGYVNGDCFNIKITEKFDFKIADMILKEFNK